MLPLNSKTSNILVTDNSTDTIKSAPFEEIYGVIKFWEGLELQIFIKYYSVLLDLLNLCSIGLRLDLKPYGILSLFEKFLWIPMANQF